mgnify:CR=1 FL=1
MSLLSIVLPAYNEEQNIANTAKVLGELLEQHGIDYELVFISDGSKDGTFERIKEESAKNPRVRGAEFSRNFGKEAGIFAGLELTTGDAVIVMDCDLQHPPETIIEMYHLWERGYEVIEGVKADRGKESFIHKIFVKMFYGMMSESTGIDMSRASDFKLLDRKAVDAFIALPERHVFFRALSSWVGFKTTSVEFKVQERAQGESKWSFASLFRYAINNVTSFSTAPMQIVMGCGIVVFIFSLIFSIYSIVKWFMGYSLEGFTTVIILLLFIGSVLMFGLGIIGYYIAKIYEEVKHRPRYIVTETTEDH